MDHLDLPTLLLCAAGLFVGGFTKGVAGLGLPMSAIPLLTLAVNLPTAALLLALPVVSSNLVQAFQQGAAIPVLRRFWPLLLPFLPAIGIGAKLLVSAEERWLYLVLGSSVLAISIVTVTMPTLVVPRRLERVLSPVVGAVAGLLGGSSSLFGPPIMIYLMALKLERAEYVATVALLYFLGSLCFLASLILLGSFGWTAALYSGLAMLPVFAGMMIGQKIGERLGRRNFQRVLVLLYVATAMTFFYKALA